MNLGDQNQIHPKFLGLKSKFDQKYTYFNWYDQTRIMFTKRVEGIVKELRARKF